MTAELVKTERADPMSLIQLALEKGASPADMAGLYDLAARAAADQAAERFAAALAGFQAECPMVFKSKRADRYTYAPYEEIKAVTRPIEAKWGISTSFDIKEDADHRLSGTCRVRVGRHFEDHTFTCPVPLSLKVNETQQYGAALTYFKRYLYCAALDIVVTGEDNDAGCLEPISANEAMLLNDMIREKNVKLAQFLDYAKVTQLSDITKTQYPILLDMLRRKKANGNGGQK